MATHSSIFAWGDPMERGALWATVHGLQRVRPDLVTKTTINPNIDNQSQAHNSSYPSFRTLVSIRLFSMSVCLFLLCK